MYDSENVYHILPTNDLKPHVVKCVYSVIPDVLPVCECDCKPRYQETENGCFLVIHNSYDGREYFEPDHKSRLN